MTRKEEAKIFAENALPEVKKIAVSLFMEGKAESITKAIAILALMLRIHSVGDEAEFQKLLKLSIDALSTCPDMSSEMRYELDRIARSVQH